MTIKRTVDVLQAPGGSLEPITRARAAYILRAARSRMGNYGAAIFRYGPASGIGTTQRWRAYRLEDCGVHVIIH